MDYASGSGLASGIRGLDGVSKAVRSVPMKGQVTTNRHLALLSLRAPRKPPHRSEAFSPGSTDQVPRRFSRSVGRSERTHDGRVSIQRGVGPRCDACLVRADRCVVSVDASREAGDGSLTFTNRNRGVVFTVAWKPSFGVGVQTASGDPRGHGLRPALPLRTLIGSYRAMAPREPGDAASQQGILDCNML